MENTKVTLKYIRRSFEVILISGAALEGISSNKSTKVMVKMKDLLNGNTWVWERGKFMNRRYLMQVRLIN